VNSELKISLFENKKAPLNRLKIKEWLISKGFLGKLGMKAKKGYFSPKPWVRDS